MSKCADKISGIEQKKLPNFNRHKKRQKCLMKKQNSI